MQRYFSKEKIDNYLILNDNDIYHIKTVMRMKDKEKIEVIYNEDLYICEVNLKDNKVKIIEEIKNEEKKDYEVCLVIPVLKEQKMDYIIQKSTELGVDRIIPFIAERSVIKVNKDNENKKITRWQKIAKEASEQSKRFDIPIIENVKSLKELISYNGTKIVCSTKKCVKNAKMFLQNYKYCDKLIIVIGPEGGLSDKEENFLVENGFIQISLGNRIMRVETVPLFVLSILNYENME